MTGQIYAVASGKGGVGKTTTVANLGVALRAQDQSVVLVDADLGMANLATYFDIEPDITLHDVLAGEASVDDALVTQAERFAVLPGTRDLEGFAAADPAQLGTVFQQLTNLFTYVLVDTGAGLGYEDVLPLGFVDEILLVATPDQAALGDASKLTILADQLGTPVRGLVLTQVRNDTDTKAAAERLSVDLVATVPYDPVVYESIQAQKPLRIYAPDSGVIEAYRQLAASLIEAPPQTP